MGKFRLSLLVAALMAGTGACSSGDSTNLKDFLRSLVDSDASLADTADADAGMPPPWRLDAACPTCDGVCTDTSRDPANCGSCGKSCAKGIACSPGKCAIECDAKEDACPGVHGNSPYCAKTRTDPTNCGGWGVSCGASATCVEGACVSCAMDVCTNRCVDTTKDKNNCGACGVTCNTLPCCHGTCTDTTLDAANCGACGSPCVFAHATATCQASTCGMNTCDSGYGDCDKNPKNGCETQLTFNLTNCGACGNTCAPAPNSLPKCLGSLCALQCNLGWVDCDMDLKNGCEVDTRNDTANCGGCGNTCLAIESCVKGSCK